MVPHHALRRAPLLALTVALVIAACGSDDDATTDSFGLGRPSTPTTDSPGTTTGSTPSPPTTSAGTDGPASSPPTNPSTTSPPGPLAEPSVSLLEIGVFDQPVEVVHRPGAGELFVVEQAGRVVAVTDLSSEVVLDVTDLTDARGEQGLLGLAFHPTEDLAYIHYSGAGGATVVAEFAVDPLTNVFDPASRREVLTVAQPYSNHNGGQLAFGPDQLLYIGLGDGGSGGDPERYALDLGSRLGKILRIDPVPTDGQPFGVPADNPFVGIPGADPTIWSYGLRNPWKFSFDAPTGDLWIADVGQGDFEEINRSTADPDRMNAGRATSYGWSAFEGFSEFNGDQSADGAELPLFVYDHAGGRCSVSGGTVARKTTVPNLSGWYVFGDYCSGQIWALDPTAMPSEPRVIEIARLDTLVAISAGPDGELYAVSNAGPIARIVAG
jgi:glucose/arabinose dehydrogenase